TRTSSVSGRGRTHASAPELRPYQDRAGPGVAAHTDHVAPRPWFAAGIRGERRATIEDGFRIEVVDGVIVLALYGVQDVAGEVQLQIAADELLESHRPMVVDLRATTYVDTAALA